MKLGLATIPTSFRSVSESAMLTFSLLAPPARSSTAVHALEPPRQVTDTVPPATRAAAALADPARAQLAGGAAPSTMPLSSARRGSLAPPIRL